MSDETSTIAHQKKATPSLPAAVGAARNSGKAAAAREDAAALHAHLYLVEAPLAFEDLAREP
jgi:hypothetical protein